ncbi:MAG TPA: tetratricopeptide repeat protein [Planctomycetota bacterium]
MIALLLLLAQDLEEGDKAYKAGDYAKAVGHFEKAVASKPDAQVWLVLGSCYLRVERPKDAVKAFREALALKAEGVDVHRALGQALLNAGQLDEAIASFRTAEARDPNGQDAYWIARVFIQREEWTQAVYELSRHRHAHPESIETLETLAYVLGRSGRHGESADAYRALARRKPLETKYLVFVAQAEAAAQRYGPAVDALEAARRRGAVDPAAARLLGDLYLTLNMPREAAAAYARLTDLKPDDWVRLGHAYLRSNETTSAREAFTKAGARPDALTQLGHLSEPADARRLFKEAGAWGALGELELKAGDAKAAAVAFAEALKTDRSAAAHYHLALALKQAGQDEFPALRDGLREHPLDEKLRALLRAK